MDTLYIPIKIEADGTAEQAGGISNDRATAERLADQSLTGEVMRLFSDDFVDDRVETIIEENIAEHHDEPHDDLVLVERSKADLAHGLLQCEVEDPGHDPDADTEQWRDARDHFADVLDED